MTQGVTLNASAGVNEARQAAAIQAAEDAGATIGQGGFQQEITVNQEEDENQNPAEGGQENPQEGSGDNPDEVAKQFQESRQANEEVKETLSKQGFDLNRIESELTDFGQLSTDTYEKLAKAGYSRAVVDQYIAGATASVERFESAVVSTVGGKENFQKVAQWASANVPKARVEAFNQAVQAGNLTTAQALLEGFNASYVKAHGTANPSVMGAAAAETQGFESSDDLVKAMSDPRYKAGNKKYIAEVQRRIQASDNLF